ncbi:MAG: THUMP domain-containing protein [Tannerella sp.]|jgi:putative N6-adenine-specific DNA methylase|nr:THUMP domain-containing protein [Tannerella sp.]
MEGEQFDMIAKTLYGLEDVLADELIQLAADDVKPGRRMVSFRGDKAMMYKANFCCRTALRILKPISRFKATDADTVYSEVRNIDWEQYLSPEKTFAIDAVVYSETFKHSKFVAYRVKDAIADYFAEKYDKRPSVRINHPDMYVHIHISHHDCTVALDSSGESLHMRGYRTEQGEAPLNEVLAAGMILKTGWRGESHFVDPMCGSGTLLIEAAMIALNVPPGLYRKEYAFERWDDFDPELFAAVSEDESEERTFPFKCFGSDVSQQALKIAGKSIRNAGLSNYIELKMLPFQQYAEAPHPGILVTNPPYGERIPIDDLTGLYAMLGERLKHVFTGYQAWILSYKDECFEKIGLRPKHKIRMMNGQLECEYRCYELFEGKNKEYKKTIDEREPDERRFGDRNPDERKFSDRKFDDRKPFERKFGARTFGDRNQDDRKFGDRKFDDRKPFERKFGARTFGDRNQDERKFGDRKFDDRKPFERKFGARTFGDRNQDERKFGDRKFDDRKPFERKFGARTFGGDRNPDERKFGDRKFDDRKPFERKFGARTFGGDRNQDERKFGDRKFDDRKPFERKFGARTFGERNPDERKFGERKFDDRKPFERKFGERAFGERRERMFPKTDAPPARRRPQAAKDIPVRKPFQKRKYDS